MSAKVQWVDCKALNAPILDTLETSCSKHQVFIVHYFFYTKFQKLIISLVSRCMQMSDLARTIGFRDILAYSILPEKYAQKILRIKLSII